jgi:N-methylhydantoinase B
MRGGLGRTIAFRIPNDEYAPKPPVNLGIQAGRFHYPPEGLFSGKHGALARFLVNGKTGNPYGMTRLYPGDRIIMDAAGGGGYGNPYERDPQCVLDDVLNGYVTLEKAREDYGVVIDSSVPKVDTEATKNLRKLKMEVKKSS